MSFSTAPSGLPDRALTAVLAAHLELTLGVEIAERRNQTDPLQNAVVDRTLYQTRLHLVVLEARFGSSRGPK